MMGKIFAILLLAIVGAAWQGNAAYETCLERHTAERCLEVVK